MKISSAIRVYGAAGVAVAIVLAAQPAYAQFKPRLLSDLATGEDYHVEATAGLWFPSPKIAVSSERFGIEGTTIDFKTDLGLVNRKFSDLRLVLRPSQTSKFRFEFIPVKYEQSATLNKDIVFNGIRYRIGMPVNSLLEWKAYRLAYEFDFISNDRGFAGFIVEAKYTDVKVDLVSPLATEFAHARAPIPALGGTGRVYVVPNISITAEVTGFKLPEELVKNTRAHYVDFDLYGTVNLTNNVGAQFGYRSLDLGYAVKSDVGEMVLKGIYFGIVGRY